MHIVILADSVDNQNAGIHFYTKNLIKSLLEIDQKNKYTFIHRRENIFFNNTNHKIVTLRQIPFGEAVRLFIEIPRQIRKLKPDIVLEPCHIGPFNLPGNIKRAVTIHDLTPILFPEFHIKNSTIAHKILLSGILKNSDLILTPSDNTKRDIEKNYKTKGNIKATNLGINKAQQSDKNPHNSHPYILYLGTIEPRKNLQTLIRAYQEIQKQIPHKLILAGDIGWKCQEIVKMAQKDPNIILTGYLDEESKADYYKHADIFVYPSIYEGFGFPPLEAMSYGVPVISSTGGSLQEILHDKALLFEPKDKESLKKHILNLVKNPALKSHYQNKGLEHAQGFTWEKTALKTLEAFQELFNNK